MESVAAGSVMPSGVLGSATTTFTVAPLKIAPTMKVATGTPRTRNDPTSPDNRAKIWVIMRCYLSGCNFFLAVLPWWNRYPCLLRIFVRPRLHRGDAHLGGTSSTAP